jgi:tetratricopeptide (TPR) repeat protein
VPEPQEQTVLSAQKPAWSFKPENDKMVVAVSPARQTLQMAGTTGVIVGAGISAISNARHRSAIQEVLEGYDSVRVFEEHLATRLKEAIGTDLERVMPLGSTAGYSMVQDARDARYERLADQGYDLLLDTRCTYGLFGYEGTLIAKLEGDLYEPSTGHALWRDTVVCSSEDLLASDKLTDPTDQLTPNYTSPRFTVEDDAVAQWTGDGGEVLRSRYEAAVEGAVSAMLMSLGLVEEPKGAYYLAKGYMNRKEFEIAEDFYQKAIALDPEYVDARNGLAVNMAHMDNYTGAIAATQAILEGDPNYGPGLYNLAWWYAVELEQPEEARPYYQQAQALGMPPHKKIDKALAQD